MGTTMRRVFLGMAVLSVLLGTSAARMPAASAAARVAAPGWGYGPWCKTPAGYSVPFLYLTSGGGHDVVLFVSQCAMDAYGPNFASFKKALQSMGLGAAVTKIFSIEVYAATILVYWAPLENASGACGNVGAYLVSFGPFLRPQSVCGR